MMTPEINLPGLREEIVKFIIEQIINEGGNFHVGESQP
jgi:hypothetical protein